jgi:O-antigen ligase
MHNGQWAGIYESKQSLGGVGAYLMFFSYCRYRVGGSWIGFAFSFLLGVTVVIGSGSRGGGAIAFCSVVVAFLSARSAAFGRLLLFVPFAVALWANALLLGLQSSAARKVTIFGVETDLTERVVIWRYALARLEQHDILGFGINGFWSDPGRYFTFLRENGWVLDNFHSGYLAILIETGLVGASIFLLFLFIYPIRMGLMYKRGNIDPFTFNTTSGVLCLTAIFNITETFFLRSTNLFSVLPVVFYLSSAAAITSAAPSWRADDAR